MAFQPLYLTAFNVTSFGFACLCVAFLLLRTLHAMATRTDAASAKHVASLASMAAFAASLASCASGQSLWLLRDSLSDAQMRLVWVVPQALFFLGKGLALAVFVLRLQVYESSPAAYKAQVPRALNLVLCLMGALLGLHLFGWSGELRVAGLLAGALVDLAVGATVATLLWRPLWRMRGDAVSSCSGTSERTLTQEQEGQPAAEDETGRAIQAAFSLSPDMFADVQRPAPPPARRPAPHCRSVSLTVPVPVPAAADASPPDSPTHTRVRSSSRQQECESFEALGDEELREALRLAVLCSFAVVLTLVAYAVQGCGAVLMLGFMRVPMTVASCAHMVGCSLCLHLMLDDNKGAYGSLCKRCDRAARLVVRI